MTTQNPHATPDPDDAAGQPPAAADDTATAPLESAPAAAADPGPAEPGPVDSGPADPPAAEPALAQAAPSPAPYAGWGATAAGAAPSSPSPTDGHGIGATWRRVWGSTLGKVAVVAAAAFATLALVGLVGTAAWALSGGAHRGDDLHRAGGCAAGQSDCDRQGPRQHSQGGQGQQQGRQRNGGMVPGQGQGQPGGQGVVPGPEMNGPGQGAGVGALGMGLLADALHAEVSVGGATPQVLLWQRGEVTAYTAGSSLTVKSSDGFAATYALTGDTATSTTDLATGDGVRVLAAKEGATALRVTVTR